VIYDAYLEWKRFLRTTCALFEIILNNMDSYVKFVKNWYQTGQEIINNYSDGGKKAALVKIDKTATMH
jgi:coatomer protein complex subunit gamma